ncbi:MAG: 1-acyl-sn-glycerol-3-phosphate acyltransferase [Betaproteobacteria bacterium]|nr:1-acyl-sn-glycerol-3-phosphate acyltransferase [Betaproteobacteria bacterium]
MVASAGMQEAIAQEAVRLGVAPAAAEERARRFAWEIASDFSYPAIRVGELLLERLWRRLYEGVVVHHGEELAKVAPGKGLVYLPNHRSHVDYLLLSYLIYAQGLAPPHIAAGANLNLPLVGPLLRRGGAFFLRRSFKGEPALRRGVPRVPARDAGPGVSDRVLHRGRAQPQRAHAGAPGRHAGHDHRELHARASAAAAAGARARELREAHRGADAGRGARRTAEARRVAGGAGRGGTQPQARLRHRGRQFRHAAVGRCVPRPAGAGLARACGRRAARDRAGAHRRTGARSRAGDQCRRRDQPDQPVRDGDRAQPPARARRARACAAGRLAADDRVAAALREGFRARRLRPGNGDRARARARLRHAHRASAGRRDRGRRRAGVGAELPAQQRAARLCAAGAGREPAGRLARGVARARRRVRRRRPAVPARRADAAALVRRSGRRGETDRRAVRRARACALGRRWRGACRRSLSSRARGARAPRPLAAAPAAPELPDDRADDAGRRRAPRARAARGADADAHAAAVAAVRVRAAGLLRALVLRLLHRHAAGRGADPRGRRRRAAPRPASGALGALRRAAAPGGRRARDPAGGGRPRGLTAGMPAHPSGTPALIEAARRRLDSCGSAVRRERSFTAGIDGRSRSRSYPRGRSCNAPLRLSKVRRRRCCYTDA